MNSAILLIPISAGLLSLLLEGSIFSDLIRAPLGDAGFYALHLSLLAIVIVAAIADPGARARLARRWPGIAMTILYGAVIVLATARASARFPLEKQIQCLLIPTTIAALTFALPALLDESTRDRLFAILLGGLAFVAAASLVVMLSGKQAVLGRNLHYNLDGRGGTFVTSGLFFERNAIGSYLQFGPALAITLWRKWRLALPAFVVIAAALLLTYSRSALAVAIVSCLPLILGATHWRTIALALCLLTVAWAAYAFSHVGLDTMNRSVYWREAYDAAWQHPFLGFGLFNVGFGYLNRETPHNFLLTQFVYYGAAGATLLVGLLTSIGRRVVSRASSTERKAILFLLMGCLLQGMVEYIITYPLFFSNSMFWLLAGMLSEENG